MSGHNLSWKKFAATVLPPLVLFAIVIACWQFLIDVLGIKQFELPAPREVRAAAIAHRSELIRATLLTGAGALSGFTMSLLVGPLVGVLFSQSRIVARSMYPYAIFLQTMPIVAVAPIIINWFGPGFVSIVVVAFVISLFPMITNAYTGMMAVDPNLLELFRLHNASRWQTLVKLRLPNSIPHLITGAKVSAGLSVIGAIVGEFFAGFGQGSFGLGYIIPQASGQLKTDYLFAAVICSALLGLAVFSAVNLVGSTILSRWGVRESSSTLRT